MRVLNAMMVGLAVSCIPAIEPKISSTTDTRSALLISQVMNSPVL